MIDEINTMVDDSTGMFKVEAPAYRYRQQRGDGKYREAHRYDGKS